MSGRGSPGAAVGSDSTLESHKNSNWLNGYLAHFWAHYWAHFWAHFWAHSGLTLGSLWAH